MEMRIEMLEHFGHEHDVEGAVLEGQSLL